LRAAERLWANVKKPVYASLLLLGFAASTAYAAKLTITGNVSQTLGASDNYFLNNSPAGPTYDSTTALALNFLARTPLTDFHLDTHASYFTYFGEGAADTSQKTGAPMGVNFNVDHRSDPLTRWNFGTSWERVDVAGTQLLQSGTSTGTGFQDTTSAHASVARDLSNLDTVSLLTTASNATYTAPGQTPYKDVNATASWIHHFSGLLKWNNSLYFDNFLGQDTAETQRLFWQANSGLEMIVSPRLNTHAAFGWVFANSYATADTSATPLSSGLFQSGAGNLPVWDVGLTYQLTKTASAALSFNRAVTPTLTGQLQEGTGVQGGITNQVNAYSSYSVTSAFSHLNGGLGSSASDLITATAGYSYRFTKELRGTASYTFTTRHDDTGVARSNTFLVSLSRDFTVLP
jgi:hypothetical protein